MIPSYKMLPCPFCGGEAFLETHHRAFVRGESTIVSLVRCKKCNAKTKKFDHRDRSRADSCYAAVTAWNCRT